MRISDWSSDVCSSDLPGAGHRAHGLGVASGLGRVGELRAAEEGEPPRPDRAGSRRADGLPGTQHVPRPHEPAYPGGRVRSAEIGRAPCRESVCKYVSISVVAVPLKKTKRTIKE